MRPIDSPTTFGRTLLSHEAIGFRLTRAVYASGAKVSAHDHQNHSWTALLAGRFEERFRTTSISCEPGSLLGKPAHATHSNGYGPDGATILVVEVTERADTVQPYVAQLFSGVTFLPPSVSGRIVRRLQASLESQSAGRELILQSALLDMAGTLVGARATRFRNQRWLDRVADRLRAEFAQPPHLDDLARDAGVHPVYLCAAFRSRFQCSPGEFVRRIRLNAARRLVETTTDSVSSIAFQCGYADQSHLTRQFSAAFGCSPRRHRKLARS
jgi:AraC family transcriptional regulator